MTDTRVALVTGAAAGIGRAVASRFANAGWTTHATDVDTLAARGCETAGTDAIERVVGRVEDRHGAVDLLVNDAGYAELGPVENGSIDSDAVRTELGGEPSDEAVVDRLRERLIDTSSSDPYADRIRTALERFVDGDREAAATTLRDRYESVCETHHPVGERAACHLTGLPDAVDESRVELVGEE